jgi:hypothetical protein
MYDSAVKFPEAKIEKILEPTFIPKKKTFFFFFFL